jgi:bacterioferritin
MKGQPAIIETLNHLLADELTAINQYMVHSEMCGNWGYAKLHEAVEKRAITEMKHAEHLIERILFLEGKPTVSVLNQINIGTDVAAQLQADLASEMMAIDAYNNALRQAGDLGDNGTGDLLQSILNDEEGHAEWIEAQLDQIAQMGIQVYLSKQME